MYFSDVSSANEVFKSHYNRTLRWSGLAAAVLTLLMIWASPQYTPHPYQPRTEILVLTEVEIIYEEIKPPEVAAPPMIPPEIEIVDDLNPDATEPILIEGPWDIFAPPAVAKVPMDDSFIASSTKPVLLFRAKPHYPEVARLAQVEGTVIVKVLVDVDGSIKAAEVIRSVHPLLNRAALKAARLCTFEPGKQRQIKVPTWVAVPYRFKLR